MSMQSSKFLVAKKCGINEQMQLKAALDKDFVEDEKFGHFAFERSDEVNVSLKFLLNFLGLINNSNSNKNLM